jgi:hypothetical protein
LNETIVKMMNPNDSAYITCVAFGMHETPDAWATAAARHRMRMRMRCAALRTHARCTRTGVP